MRPERVASLLLLLCLSKAARGQTAEACFCDVTRGACDVGCCCDAECEGKWEAFRECVQPQPRPARCLSPGLVFRNNAPTNWTRSSPSLLCLYSEKSPDLPDRPPISSEEDWAAAEEQLRLARPDLAPRGRLLGTGLPPAPAPPTRAFYKVGDPLWTEADGVLGHLRIPSSGLSFLCAQPTPVTHLRPRRDSCQLPVRDWGQDCAKLRQLSAIFYTSFRIFTEPKSVNASMDQDDQIIATSNGMFAEQRIFLNDVETDADNLKTPSWTDGKCNDAVSEARLTFILNDTTGGIVRWEVRLSTSNASSPESQLWPLVTETSFVWSSEDASKVRRLSGSPGYQVGKPLMAGTLVQVNDTKSHIELSPSPSSWLEVVGGGECGEGRRASVLFGEDLLTGCSLSVGPATDCAALAREILAALGLAEGANEWAERRVGALANASAESVGDWVPVQLSLPSKAARRQGSACVDVLRGLEVVVLWAPVGDALRPQAKVLGVRAVGVAGEMEHPPARPRRHPVLLSLHFRQLPALPQQGLAKIQTFDAKLPADFFYPFSGGP